MEALQLFGEKLSGYHAGSVQRSGPISVLPLFGPDHGAAYASPLSGLKLAGVKGYGNVTLENAGARGVAIVPLHIGYIQDQAQNHALCRSTFIGSGQKLLIEDACCVQQTQGGFLESKEQWFFILPLELRADALKLRGQKSYSKLWGAIAKLCEAFGMESKGHLEQIVCRERSFLTQYANRFELLPQQTGAAFFYHEKLVGVELTPSPTYFAELWTALVCFCYGPWAMRQERKAEVAPKEIQAASVAHALPGKTLAELRSALVKNHQESQQKLWNVLTNYTKEKANLVEEERYLTQKLYSLDSKSFLGQLVQKDGATVYASIFARTW
jgi:hypothetical protein